MNPKWHIFFGFIIALMIACTVLVVFVLPYLLVADINAVADEADRKIELVVSDYSSAVQDSVQVVKTETDEVYESFEELTPVASEMADLSDRLDKLTQSQLMLMRAEIIQREAEKAQICAKEEGSAYCLRYIYSTNTVEVTPCCPNQSYQCENICFFYGYGGIGDKSLDTDLELLWMQNCNWSLPNETPAWAYWYGVR